MALEDIVNVQITLETTPVTTAGFGIPVFAGEHRWFTERIKSYSSIKAVAVDIPSTSNEYAAATSFFSSDVSPSTIKIARRDVDLITLTPDAATAIGQIYTLDVRGTDGTVFPGEFITSTGSETSAEIATSLEGQLTGATGVNVSDGGGFLTLQEATPGVGFSISDISSNVVDTYDTTENAADMLTAIEGVDIDWYFMTTNDHSADFISTPTFGMAAQIETREKLFFYSSQAEQSLLTFNENVSDSDPDVLGFLKVGQYLRSVGMFSADADEVFPECRYISRFAPKNPGETTWTQKNIKEGLAKDPDTGLVLNETQLNNLNNRNANFVQSQGGVAIIRRGITQGGERIENMRFRDFLVARITEAYQLKAINTEKIPYTDSGINGQRSVLESVLGRYVTTRDVARGLQEAPAFNTTFPRRADVSQDDLIAGTLNATFEAFLSGAILITKIVGTLSFEDLTV